MTAYYNDNDPSAAAWLRELMREGHIPEGEVDERSILDVEPADLAGFHQCHFFAGIGGWAYALRLAGWTDDRPVWTGSPPCQPFSVAGKGLARDDPRHLAPHFLELVTACRPPVLFGEQVASADVFGKAVSGMRREQADILLQRAQQRGLEARLQRMRERICENAGIRPGSGSTSPGVCENAAHDTSRRATSCGCEAESEGQEAPFLPGLGRHSAPYRRGCVRSDGSAVRPDGAEIMECSVSRSDCSRGRVHPGEHKSGSVLAEYDGEQLGAGRDNAGCGSHVGETLISYVARIAGEVDGELEETSQWAWIDDVFLHLERAGYACGTSSVPACSAGAPHIRQRCFFGAYDLRPAAGGMGDTAGQRPFAGPQPGVCGGEEVAGTWDAEPERRGDVDRLEHPAGDGREQRRAEPSWRSAAGGCGTDRLADAHGGEPWRSGPVQPGREHGLQPQGGGVVGMADADDAGPQGRVGMRERADQRASGQGGVAVGQPAAGPVNGFWRDADWLRCTDGRWRAVEPGTFPLAARLPGRVALLRGAGNAIVPQLAAAFIGAFMEAAE